MGLSDLLNVKDIYDLIKKGSNLEAQEAVMRYREMILEQQEELLRLREENRELKEKQSVKDRVIKTAADMIYLDNGDSREGPYCLRCYETEEKLFSLKHSSKGGKDIWVCRVCNHAFGGTL